jgi:DNA-binding MarR family transcriptional regulator
MTKLPQSAEMARLQEAGSVCACFNLRKAARAVTSMYDEALRPTGLRATQLPLLMITKVLGTTTVTQLAEAVVMDRTTLTRNLRPLEKRGLIRVEEGEDRRVRHVTIRPRGLEVLRKAIPLWREAQARMTGGLGEARFQQLVSNLNATVAVARSGATSSTTPGATSSD